VGLPQTLPAIDDTIMILRQCLILSPWSTEQKADARRKFLFLWFVTTLPLLFSAFAKPSTGDFSNASIEFFSNLWNAFSGRHQFIYAVSFITPVLYLLWERYKDARKAYLEATSDGTDVSGANLYQRFTPEGYGWMLSISICVFLITAVSYTLAEAHVPGTPKSLAHRVSPLTAVAVYLYGLFCWYYCVLEGVGEPTGRSPNQHRKAEQSAVKGFHAHLHNKDRVK
jgi:hypothetical protein